MSKSYLLKSSYCLEHFLAMQSYDWFYRVSAEYFLPLCFKALPVLQWLLVIHQLLKRLCYQELSGQHTPLCPTALVIYSISQL